MTITTGTIRHAQTRFKGRLQDAWFVTASDGTDLGRFWSLGAAEMRLEMHESKAGKARETGEQDR